MELIIGSKKSPAIAALISTVRKLDLEDAILYTGYPLLRTADETVAVDALLTSTQYGVVVFDVLNDTDGVDENFWTLRQDFQTDLYLSVKSQLTKHKALTRGRELAVPVQVVTFAPERLTPSTDVEDMVVASPSNLFEVLENHTHSMSDGYLRPLNAAIQRVSTIKPSKKRHSVSKADSRGAILKQIEKQIANLDRWQKSATIETPEGPQRIRGLAGSGKTVVLALKAAYLHTMNPDWTIAVTYYSRSLYGQFIDLIRRFSFEHAGDEPDWNKLKVMHSWGSSRDPGVYYEIAEHYGVQPKDFSYAKRRFGRGEAFGGICDELFEVVQGEARAPLYDAILIDEAQDLPASFFQLAHCVTRDPKRIIWAYDELQNLGSYSMQPPSEMFGVDESGVPRVQLRNPDGEPHQDVILPVCYRNTPWALAVAHGLGFGTARDGGLVQLFDEQSLWNDIGYELVNGSLKPGGRVALRRKPSCSPSFFRELLNPADALTCKVFSDEADQAVWVANQIRRNLETDELEPDDIVVIFPDPITVSSKAATLVSELRSFGINAHIAGVTSSRDEFFNENSVAISGIYRAKGNEAPMIYVLNSDYCYGGYELIRKRNTLFTAITRSRGWVRICGCGDEMEKLKAEFERIVSDGYQLRFTVPSDTELAKLRKIHRDMTVDERKTLEDARTKLADVLGAIESGEIDFENLPVELRKRLTKVFGLYTGD